MGDTFIVVPFELRKMKSDGGSMEIWGLLGNWGEQKEGSGDGLMVLFRMTM
jgi:hypothetical protein